jgi:hypothetical protein
MPPTHQVRSSLRVHRGAGWEFLIPHSSFPRLTWVKGTIVFHTGQILAEGMRGGASGRGHPARIAYHVRVQGVPVR